MFVLVIDTSMMNVSIAAAAEDLGTVSGFDSHRFERSSGRLHLDR
jgi:hypothetical protein